MHQFGLRYDDDDDRCCDLQPAEHFFGQLRNILSEFMASQLFSAIAKLEHKLECLFKHGIRSGSRSSDRARGGYAYTKQTHS